MQRMSFLRICAVLITVGLLGCREQSDAPERTVTRINVQESAGKVVPGTAQRAAGVRPRTAAGETTAASDAAEPSGDDAADTGTIVKGKITLHDGSPADFADVRLKITNDPEGSRETSASAEGLYRISMGGHSLAQVHVRHARGAAAALQAYHRQAPNPTASRKEILLDIQLEAPAPISGKVVDENDRPIGGAGVLAFVPDVEGRPRERSVDVVETTSSAEGTFILEGVASGVLTLNVNAADFVPKSQEVAAPVENMLIRLSRTGGIIEGGVFRHGSGQAIPGAKLQLFGSVSPETKTRRFYRFNQDMSTDEQGTFRFDKLPPGDFRLFASTADLRPLPNGHGGYQTISVDERETTSGIIISLYPGHTIYGTVTDADSGEPIEGVKVLAASTQRGDGLRDETDFAGTYRIEKVFEVSAHASLLAEKPGYTMASGASGGAYQVRITGGLRTGNYLVPLTASELEVKRDLQLQKTLSISGTVKNTEGRPIAGAAVSLYQGYQGGGNSGSTKSDSEGHYEIQASPNIVLRLKASADGYGTNYTAPLTIENKPLTQIDVILGLPGSISGVVVGPDDQPLAEAEVEAQQLVMIANTGWHELAGKTTSDAQGKFSLAPVPATDFSEIKDQAGAEKRTMQVSASKKGFAKAVNSSVQLKPGEVREDIRLKLLTGHFLAGRVTQKEGQPLEGVNVYAYLGSSGNSAQSDKDGKFRIEDLAPGNARVYLNHTKYASTTYENLEVDKEHELVMGAGSGTLIGHVVNWETGTPITEFTIGGGVEGPEKNKPAPGDFTMVGLDRNMSYSVTVQAEGVGSATEQITIPPDADKIEKTFKVGPGGGIVGRVVEQGTKKPLAGVRVAIVGSDFYYSLNSRPLQSQTTGEDGRFKFGKVQAGNSFVDFKPQAPLANLRKSYKVEHGVDFDAGDVELGSGASVKVTVLRTPEDTPVSDVSVLLNSNTRSLSRTEKTNSEGIVEFAGLMPQYYSVNAEGQSAGFLLGENENRDVVLKIGSATLKARVIKGGNPVPSIYVSLNRSGAGPNVSRSAQTDSNGEFTMEKIAPGGWEVSVNFGNRNVEDWVDVQDRGITEKTFVIPSSKITGKVVHDDGKAGAGARVYASPIDSTKSNDIFSPSRGGRIDAQADGSFLIDGLEPGAYNITAVLGSSRSPLQRLTVPADGDGGPVELKLSPAGGGKLISTVYNMGTAKPMTGGWCKIVGPDGPFSHSAVRGEDGIITVSGIPPGRYEIQVSAFGYSVGEHSVDIKDGEETRIEDVLYAAGSMRWIIKDGQGKPIPGVDCTITPVDSNSIEKTRRGLTDTEGIFATRGLYPASYNGVATVNGKTITQTFTIPSKGHDEKESRVE